MIDLDSGTLYISGPDGTTQKLGEVSELKIEPTLDDIPPYIAKINENFEASIECFALFNEQVMLIVTGMYDIILYTCPNKRVAYLAKYGKKKRTRKKNLHRAIKILEGMSNG